MRIFTIDGNIGSGKSTVLDVLRGRGYPVLPEPVDDWAELLQAAASGHDPKGTLRLQVAVWRDRCMRRPHDPRYDILFMERSTFFQLHTFVHANHALGRLDELDLSLLTSMYNAVDWNPEAMIYLRVSPTECGRRVALRGRVYEQDIREYLQLLHECHERTAAGAAPVPIITLDGARPSAEIADQILGLVYADPVATIMADLEPIDPARLECPEHDYIPLPVELDSHDPDPLHRAFLPNAELDLPSDSAPIRPHPRPRVVPTARHEIDTFDANTSQLAHQPAPTADPAPTPRPVVARLADALEGVGKTIHLLATALRSSQL